MKVISIAQFKGGSGKSTTTVQLATTAFRALGYRALIVDTDVQGSATKWRARRQAPAPDVIQSTPDRLEDTIRQIRQDAGLCFIDTPGHDWSALAKAAVVSDLTVIATRPSEFDRETAVQVVAALRQFGLRHLILLTQTPHRRSSKLAVWEEAHARMGVLAEPALTTLQAFQDSVTIGLGVEEYEPNGRAAHEVRVALAWILDHLDGGRR